MKKTIYILIALIAVLIAILSYGMFNKKLESTAGMKVDVRTTAEALVLEFEEDEDSANQKYLDKVVEVTGIVDKVEDKEGTRTVYLDANHDLSMVICQLEEGTGSTIQPNESLTLRGVCTGYLMDVVLVRGVLAKK